MYINKIYDLEIVLEEFKLINAIMLDVYLNDQNIKIVF